MILPKVHKLYKLFNFSLKKKYYDYIISIGQGCSCPMILERLHYRSFSGPLDWTFVKDYTSAINVVKNRFDKYFEKEDLQFRQYQPKTFNNEYENRKNFICHPHCFPKSMSFDEAYAAALEKYNRRIKRFLDLVNNAKTKNILLLYIERAFDDEYAENKDSPRIIITNETLTKDIDELNLKYGKNVFDILFIKHNDSLKMDEYTINERIISVNNSPTIQERVCLGNYKFLAKFIRRIVGIRFGNLLQIKLHNFIKNNRTLRYLKKMYIIIKTCQI